jgi:hypothetical protein
MEGVIGMEALATWINSRGIFEEGQVTGTLKIRGEEIEVCLQSVELLSELVEAERDWYGRLHRQPGKMRRRFVLVEP